MSMYQSWLSGGIEITSWPLTSPPLNTTLYVFRFFLQSLKDQDMHIARMYFLSFILLILKMVCARSVNSMSYRIKHVLGGIRFKKTIPEMNSFKFLYFFFFCYIYQDLLFIFDLPHA